ncbi:MAG TPA: 50S ribosomal protein L21 [Planctomycetota bacterium]|nr:50S ribosomal protein L21 [Planctomycetota bacterium]
MYAVIETGGKQYKVSPGDTIEVELLSDDAGEPVEFERVLFYSDGADVRCGAPIVSGVRVVGTVIAHKKGVKVVVGKFKSRSGYRRKQGHRQQLTRVAIERIAAN